LALVAQAQQMQAQKELLAPIQFFPALLLLAVEVAVHN
jgi:hypothetical protein